MTQTSLQRARLYIGIDVGGTFTDFVVYDATTNHLQTFKYLSSHPDPADAVLEGLASFSSHLPRTLIHGSTVATNALLERKGAKTAFVATRGFRDLLNIGRQTRTHLYDWLDARPEPLIASSCCWDMTERVDHNGCVLMPLNEEEIPSLLQNLQSSGIESVAISFLFSFASPAHEKVLAQRLRDAGFFVSASHEVVPEFREYERSVTTVVNAYVSPILNRYLGRLSDKMAPSEFHILQSNGGRLRVADGGNQGVRSILSGPAGGVVGAVHVAKLAGFERVITFDMGGTSTDVSVVDGQMQVTNQAQIGGLPIRVPVIDLHTVGAGGGSLALMDKGGSLRVGPKSAGAQPGPVCYGLGGIVPIVTDANLVLGRLPDHGLLGGQMAIDTQQASHALRALAEALHIGPSTELTEAQVLAKGVKDVVNAQMERALRVISVERGYDPREFVFVSFGGAGGVHACELAQLMGMNTILIPRMASTLSAYGMLVADVVVDYGQTIMRSGETPFEELDVLMAPLIERGMAELVDQGVEREQGIIRKELDVRYVGQSYELTIPFSRAFRGEFDAMHDQQYGFHNQSAPIEIVNMRVRVVSPGIPPLLPTQKRASADPSSAFLGKSSVVLDHTMVAVPHYQRERLLPGNAIVGPAIIAQADTTTYVTPGDQCCVDEYANLVIERRV